MKFLLLIPALIPAFILNELGLGWFAGLYFGFAFVFILES